MNTLDEQYQEIIDEVYSKYKTEIENSLDENSESPEDAEFFKSGLVLSKEDFIDEIKTDSEFSEKWGLKIEEKELSLDERVEYYCSQSWVLEHLKDSLRKQTPEQKNAVLSVANIPTKLITITYKNKIIESYE